MAAIKINEDIHGKLKQLTKQFQKDQTGATMNTIVDILLKASERRIQRALSDNAIPIEALGVSFLNTFMALSMIDEGSMSEAEFEIIVKNWERLGDEIFIRFDMQDAATRKNRRDTMALEDNYKNK